MSRGRESGEPVQLGDAVAAVGRELGMPAPDALATLAGAWPEIVGDAVVGHAIVRSVRDGICTIAVGSPTAGKIRMLNSALPPIGQR